MYFSKEFSMLVSVLQGFVLSNLLFIIVVDDRGVYVRPDVYWNSCMPVTWLLRVEFVKGASEKKFQVLEVRPGRKLEVLNIFHKLYNLLNRVACMMVI